MSIAFEILFHIVTTLSMPYYLDLEIIPHRDYNYKRDSGNSAKSTNIIAAFHEIGVYGYYYRSELVVAEPGGEVSAQTTP